MVGLERLLIGRTLAGRFAIEELIGRGRAGLVYRARDGEAGTEVALKVLTALSTPEARERYRRLVAGEVATASAIQHPQVVAVHALGFDPELELDFITSELVRGQTLASVLAQRGKPPISLGLRLLQDAADGLAAAHRAGLVHRDLRPASLYMVRSEAERQVRVKVAGFGLPQIVRRESLIGSPEIAGYASPEMLANGSARLTPASDVFSLGAIGYELMTGALPFDENGRRALAGGATAEVEPPQGVSDAVPPHVLDALLQALRIAPAERFADASALAEALRQAPAQAASPAVVAAPAIFADAAQPATPAEPASAHAESRVPEIEPEPVMEPAASIQPPVAESIAIAAAGVVGSAAVAATASVDPAPASSAGDAAPASALAESAPAELDAHADAAAAEVMTSAAADATPMDVAPLAEATAFGDVAAPVDIASSAAAEPLVAETAAAETAAAASETVAAAEAAPEAAPERILAFVGKAAPGEAVVVEAAPPAEAPRARTTPPPAKAGDLELYYPPQGAGVAMPAPPPVAPAPAPPRTESVAPAAAAPLAPSTKPAVSLGKRQKKPAPARPRSVRGPAMAAGFILGILVLGSVAWMKTHSTSTATTPPASSRLLAGAPAANAPSADSAASLPAAQTAAPATTAGETTRDADARRREQEEARRRQQDEEQRRRQQQDSIRLAAQQQQQQQQRLALAGQPPAPQPVAPPRPQPTAPPVVQQPVAPPPAPPPAAPAAREEPAPVREASNEVFDASDVEVRPRLSNGAEIQRSLQSRYPDSLVGARVSGSVMATFVVNADGRVDPSSVRILSSPNPAFNAPTQNVLRRARFRPATVRGQPVRVQVSMPVQWTAP